MRGPVDPFGPRHWRLAHGRSLTLGPKGMLMGILNVTLDSFSDGGRIGGVDDAIAAAKAMIEAGAAIIDIGGESTRPGADPLTAEEEQRRVLPVIEALASTTDAILSIDTYHAKTAGEAIDRGAHAVNDVWGLQKDPHMARTVAQKDAGLVIMHTGRDRAVHSDPVEDQRQFLARSLELAREAGIAGDRIVLDPGFGFAKDAAHNFTLMARWRELHDFGYPLLAGTSRKRFLGEATGREAVDRDIATAATTALLRMAGAAIFRVHDVASNHDALAVADRVLEASDALREVVER